MKQRISIDQLNELTDDQKNRLREWWKPQLFDVFYLEMIFNDDDDSYIGCIDRETYIPDPRAFPLLSIGQMNHFLQEKANDFGIHYNDSGVCFYVYLSWSMDTASPDRKFMNDELCDALWDAVKRVL